MTTDTTTLVQRVRSEGATNFDLTAELGVGLMQGDPTVFKAGYTFANALNAACECAGIDKPIRIAIVAERMHSLLMKGHTFGPEIEQAFPGDIVAQVIADTLVGRGMGVSDACTLVEEHYDYDQFGKIVDSIEDTLEPTE